MERKIASKEQINNKKNASRSAKWSLVSISGIISLASIIVVCLFVIFASSHMLIAGWVITALAVMGIAMAGAVIKS